MKPQRDFLPALTAIRFFGATVVVMFHAQGLLGIPKRWLNDYGVHGFMALFFVISGFVMVHCYPELKTGESRKNFYAARFARIWPLHLATFFLALFLRPPELLWEYSRDFSIQALSAILNLTLFQAWIPLPWSYFSFNDVSWSISAEMFFYLSFPVVLATWRTHWTRWILGALFLTGGAMVLCAVMDIPAFKGNPNGLNSSSLFHVNPFVRWLEFMTGMLAATVYGRNRDFFLKLQSKAAWTLIEFFVFAFFILNMVGAGQGKDYGARLFGTGVGAWMAHSGVLPGCFLLVLMLTHNAGWITHILSRKIFVLLGEASFAIYLLHSIFLQRMDIYEVNPFSFLPRELQFFAFMCVLSTVSILSWKYFEMPVRRWIYQRIAVRKTSE